MQVQGNPTCGRIVLVWVPGAEIVRPAIVIEATGGSILAQAFGVTDHMDQGGFVGKFTPDTLDANGEAVGTPGTWHWPPREPQEDDDLDYKRPGRPVHPDPIEDAPGTGYRRPDGRIV